MYEEMYKLWSDVSGFYYRRFELSHAVYFYQVAKHVKASAQPQPSTSSDYVSEEEIECASVDPSAAGSEEKSVCNSKRYFIILYF